MTIKNLLERIFVNDIFRVQNGVVSKNYAILFA